MSENGKRTTFISPINNNARIVIGIDKTVSIFGREGEHFADIEDCHTAPAVQQLEELRSLITDAIAELESR